MATTQNWPPIVPPASSILEARADDYRLILSLVSDYSYAYRIEPDGRVKRLWMTDGFTRVTGFATDEFDHTEGFFVSGLDDDAMARLRTPPQGHGPLGSLRYDGKPVRYDDVSESRHSFGFPSHHPEMQAMVGV